ncbi:adenylyl-sulfate kinase [Rhizobium sp. 007]|uniref:adenylyl-sulfate kinase n=1 Tax=Rhizobium sp. 007 TaxID=2785056 RepID=UPI00188E58A2|nr:adenylyl-sulfate kinase [Rhizobium sp. 007]QPB24344.1 adenylyl-sulfate kinase [Rhizobium sp. 007]
MRRGLKILVMGLTGAGKTTFSRALAPLLNAVHFNADDVRANISRDLGFALEDRLEQAKRMGWLCDKVCEAGHNAIADFVCPTSSTRDAFGSAFVIWLDRIREGRFSDTNLIFEHPQKYDVRIPSIGDAQHWAQRVASEIQLHGPDTNCGDHVLNPDSLVRLL